MQISKTIVIALRAAICSSICCVIQTGAAESTDTAEVAELKAQVAELKGMLPTQAHAMVDADYHFTNLWFAAKQANWPLATFYLNETRGRLNWALRIKQVRKLASGQDLDLKPMLQSIEQSGLAQLKSAIEQRSFKEFETAYRQAAAQCHACHLAAEKPFLKLHIPTSPATGIIDFRP